MGHDVKIIDPFGLVTDVSDQLNPLDVLARPGVELESEAQALAMMLAGGTEGLKEPFWEIWGRSLVSGLVAYVAQHEPKESRTFGRVRELLKNDDVVFSLAKLLDEHPNVKGLARTEIASFLQLTDVTRSGVLATAQSFTEVVNSAPARKTLSGTTIDLDAVASGAPVTIYLVIPPDKLASHGALLRLWIGALLKTVMCRAERPEQDTLFIIDECAQLGQLEHLRVAMTLLRGYGLKVWAFFQDLSQLRRLYPEDWQCIVNNAAVFQTFGLTNHVMATETASIVGDVDAFALRSLARDRQVVAAARARAEVCGLPDYLRDPEFEGRFDANPMFARRDAVARGMLL
jgi:type IV secretion system protein VirD4